MADPETTIDLAAYLQRVGWHGALAPDLATLRALHEAHIQAIPFETLDIELGRPISLALPDIQRKLLRERRGGYCFEHNSLFQAVLTQIGFDITPLMGRVNTGQPKPGPRSHKLLIAKLAEGPYLVDVGFAGRGLGLPLPMQEGAQDQWGIDAYRLIRREGYWVQQTLLPEDWVDLYTFSEERAYPIDYVVANHYTSTHPEAFFVQHRFVHKRTTRGRIYILDQDLIIKSKDRHEVRPIDTPEHLLAVLRAEFGLVFPPDTPFRQRQAPPQA